MNQDDLIDLFSKLNDDDAGDWRPDIRLVSLRWINTYNLMPASRTVTLGLTRKFKTPVLLDYKWCKFSVYDFIPKDCSRIHALELKNFHQLEWVEDVKDVVYKLKLKSGICADFRMFTNLRVLHISYSDAFDKDFVITQSIKEISLSDCPNIVNVSSLSKVPKVSLSNCPGIVEVRHFVGTELSINNLSSLKALSARVKILRVSYIRHRIALKTQCLKLYVRRCPYIVTNIDNVGELQKIVIEDKDDPIDARVLEKCRKIEFSQCQVTNIWRLNNCAKVSFGYDSAPIDYKGDRIDMSNQTVVNAVRIGFGTGWADGPEFDGLGGGWE